MDDIKYVSFYQLAKELASEEGKVDLSQDEFKNYRESKQEYFETILRLRAVNPDLRFKVDGKYQIPIKDKEVVKFLIKQYTSKYYKKIRQGKEPGIEDIKELVESAKKFIYSKYEEKDAEEQLNSLLRVTELRKIEKSKEVEDEVTKAMRKSLKNIEIDEHRIYEKKSNGAKTEAKRINESNIEIASYRNINDMIDSIDFDKSIVMQKTRDLSENDVLLLIQIYQDMILQIDKMWNRLADIFSEQRNLESGEDEEEVLCIIMPKDSGEILNESIEVFREEIQKKHNPRKFQNGYIDSEIMEEILRSIKDRK